MRATKYQKNGETHMRFEKFVIKIQPGQVKDLRLTNLFQGNQVLEDIGNSFISGNSQFWLTEVYPGLEVSLAEIFTNIANKLTSEATYDEMFPNI